MSPAILSVLREDTAAAKLKTIATLPNAARPAPIGLSGEQGYAVRFMGDRAYVVTFRRFDPAVGGGLGERGRPQSGGRTEDHPASRALRVSRWMRQTGP